MSTFPVVKGVLLSSKHYTWNTADSLGRGASAVVYLGRKRDTGQVVAVKSFHKHLLPASRNADLRELDLLSQLNHRNIIQFLDIQFEDGSKQPVLIMEYCEGGSLHHMLEQPTYYYGLPEDEYLFVLTHVAEGMAYLRKENIIHRDIKPGNIMRFIMEEGSSVYKLTDFGAARNLNDEEQFESLYGTEEYLHPGVYERAVLRQATGQTFDARVDLWSLGVTFYHAATGRLPFQPYGGRSNKELMFQIISQKESGVISGIQRKENGPIDWKRELPESSPLSNGLRALVTPLLSGLMEPDQSKMITYETFFRIVAGIGNKRPISIFQVCTCQEIVIYAEKGAKYSDLQDAIASQCDLAASNQILLISGKPMDQVVDPMMPIEDFPAELLEESIFLFQKNPREEFRLKDPEIFPFPDIKTYSGMDMDSRHANICCALCELLCRYVKNVSKHEELLLNGLVCLRLYVEDGHKANMATLELLQRLMQEFDLHVDTFFTMVKKLRDGANTVKNKESLKRLLEENIVREVFDKAKDRVQEIENYGSSLATKLGNIKTTSAKLTSPCKRDKCIPKVLHHQTVISGIQNRFRRDKNVRAQMTAHDEKIHHWERDKLHSHCMSLKGQLINHCLPHQARLFGDALKVSDSLIRCYNNQDKVEVNINSVLNCQKLLSTKIVKMLESAKKLEFDSGFVSGEASGSSMSLMSSVSETTRSLERKLNDLKMQLDENSQYLRSLEDGPLSFSIASEASSAYNAGLVASLGIKQRSAPGD